MRLFRCFFCVLFFAAIPLFAGIHERSDAPATLVYETGKALPAQIHVLADADPSITEAAELLRRVLSQMTGVEWKIVTYPKEAIPTSGLVINGDLSEFPIPKAENADQGYVIFSDGKKIEIAATSPLGIVHGTAAFAHELGYRRFFGSKRWEHFPQLKKISFAAKIIESPDFTSRNIWVVVLQREDLEDAKEYRWANLYGGKALNTGHMYETFIRARKDTFAQHPEYRALVKGSRTQVTQDVKLCISNPGLRAEMVSYIRELLTKNPDLYSVSMDPSDGGNWCECEPCAKLGSVSTRVVTLANEAARMIRSEFPGKKIGFYAYAHHSPPPDIKVEPEIIVSVATAFLQEGWTYERLVKAWSEKGVAQFGTRDYHDVVIWSDWWTPGRAKGTNTQFCTEGLKNYYYGGSRYYLSEGGWVFASNGLGYYLSMRTLWNVKEAANKNDMIQDFLQTMFGPAAKAMGEYYELVDGKNKPLLSEDLAGRMYRHLADALKSAKGDPVITRRIADLALYARHSELLLTMRTNPSPEIQKEFLQHAARVRPDQIFPHRSVRRHAERFHSDAAATIKWDNTGSAYTLAEIADMVKAGVEWNKLISFKPVQFSDDLRPFPIEGTKRFDFLYHRGSSNYYTYIANPSKPITLQLTGGLIYRNRGNVRVELYQIGGASETGERETFICKDDSTPPDKEPHSVSLRARASGLHKIVISDGSDQTRIEWQEGTPMMFDAGHPNKMVLHRRASFYFYIPSGTKVLGFYAKCKGGSIYNSVGEEVLKFTKDSPIGYFDVEVPASEGGKLWSFRNGAGEISLLNVPPYAALSGDELMVPQEVISPK